MPIVKLYEIEYLKPKDEVEKGNLNVGDRITILTPAEPRGTYGKYHSEVKFNGEKRLFSFNNTTVRNMIEIFSNDTDEWVGKEMEFLGKQKCGSMSGYVWKAVV